MTVTMPGLGRTRGVQGRRSQSLFASVVAVHGLEPFGNGRCVPLKRCQVQRVLLVLCTFHRVGTPSRQLHSGLAQTPGQQLERSSSSALSLQVALRAQSYAAARLDTVAERQTSGSGVQFERSVQSAMALQRESAREITPPRPGKRRAPRIQGECSTVSVKSVWIWVDKIELEEAFRYAPKRRHESPAGPCTCKTAHASRLGCQKHINTKVSIALNVVTSQSGKTCRTADGPPTRPRTRSGRKHPAAP